ncbi:MAG: hypothetical protein ACHREM_15960 [Polyangiales bacterium]
MRGRRGWAASSADPQLTARRELVTDDGGGLSGREQPKKETRR